MMEESPQSLDRSLTAMDGNTIDATENTSRSAIYDFLEGKTTLGGYYEGFTIFLILLNVLGFVVGTQFDEHYVPNALNALGVAFGLLVQKSWGTRPSWKYSPWRYLP